jgi:hypothetical protein
MGDVQPSNAPGFFGVIGRPRSYLNALYLLLAMPLGTVYFTVVVTGISLGISLMVVALVGVPILIALWYVVHVFMQLERALAAGLVGVSAPPVDPLPAWPGGLWKHFKNFMRHAPSWKALLYFVLRFPVAVVVFTVAVTLISVSLGMAFAPVYMWASDSVTWGDRTIDPFWPSFALVPIGVILVPVSLHVMNALAKGCARWSAWSVGRSPTNVSVSTVERPAA